MYLNYYVFIFFKDDEVVLWDYKKHQQYLLDEPYWRRLLAFAKDPVFQPENPIDQHFFQEGIFVESKPVVNWGWDDVSHIFHVGTKDVPLGYDIDSFDSYITEYVRFCENQTAEIVINTEKDGKFYDLPAPNLDVLGQKSFLSVLQERMTSRFFYKEPLSLEEVSTLLYAVFGQIHGEWKDFEQVGLQSTGVRKSSPSAGGLQASEAYVLAMDITDLPQGIYHYRSHQHVLSLITDDLKTLELGKLLAGQHFAEDLPLGIFITSRFEKLWSKYRHSRGYRMVFLDVGHLSQTFQLCAAAMNLDSWLTGAFLDTEVNKLLKIEDTPEQAIFFVGAGRGRRQFLDEKTVAFLKSSPRESVL